MNDEECIQRMTATLRTAIEHERNDHREDREAVDAAVGAFFEERRSGITENAKHGQLPTA